MILEFEFKTPPISVNECTMPSRGRLIKTPEARAWSAAMKLELMSQKGSLPKYCYYSVQILTPGKYSKDADNSIKPTVDVLHQMGRVPNDFYTMRVGNEFYPGNEVVVIIKILDLDHWRAIKKPSPGTLRKLKKCYEEIKEV